jgi:hypothetical protein
MGHTERHVRFVDPIDLNVVWRPEGSPSLLWKSCECEERQSFTRRMRKRLTFKALHSFKKASRFYGDRQFLKCGCSQGFNTAMGGFLLKYDATV